MNIVICVACQQAFTPKEGGHNAKYCSKSCKHRIRKRPTQEQRRRWRRSSWEVTRSNPLKYERHKRSSKKSKTDVRDWLANYKMSRGCIDCGFNGHFAALQLDHIGRKDIPISHARSSIGRLMAEISEGNCVVRCANCHSIKTWAEKNHLEYNPSLKMKGVLQQDWKDHFQISSLERITSK